MQIDKSVKTLSYNNKCYCCYETIMVFKPANIVLSGISVHNKACTRSYNELIYTEL